MTDASSGTTSQYAVIAPISFSSDISPSRPTRESSNVFLQEHTVLSELKNRERSKGKVKYVDLELNNVGNESREEEPVFKRDATHNPNKEDWTFPRPKARKTPPPIIKPKPISKAKSTAQIPLSGDVTSPEPAKQRTASESDTLAPPSSVKRPSRKAPPPPKQIQQGQCDKEISASAQLQQPSSNGTKETVRISPPSLRSQSSDRELKQVTSPSPPLTSKELVDGVPHESPKQPRASPPQDGKVYRPVRKAPPPPNRSTEYINVIKNGRKESSDMFSTFFVSHKKSQSLGYVNVSPSKDRCSSVPRSRVSASPQHSDEYENVVKEKVLHRSDEGIAHSSQEFENVVVPSTESKPNNTSSESKPNVVDSGGSICQNQEITPKSKENTYPRQSTKRKSIKKKKIISPPHSPPPPPPPGVNRKLTSPTETDDKVIGSLSPPPPGRTKRPTGRTKRPMAPAPPPPAATRRPNAPPPPPPDTTQAASLQVVLPPPPPPPPVETAAPKSSSSKSPSVPHVTTTQVPIVHNSKPQSEPDQNDTTEVKTAQVSLIDKLTSNKLSPEFSKLNLAKRPPTSPPSVPPPPPPTFPSAFPATPPGHGGHVAFIMSSDVESGEDSNISSASASETSMLQQEEDSTKDAEVVDELVKEANNVDTNTSSFFLRQTSRELEPITEYADTESSGSVYITRTVSNEALDWTSDDQKVSSENSPDLNRVNGGGDSSSSEDCRPRRAPPNIESPLVSRIETSKTVSQQTNSETDNGTNEVEAHSQEEYTDDSLLRDKVATSTANPFWYRESMLMAVTDNNAVNHMSTRKPPVPPPRSSTLGPPLIQDFTASPARVRRAESNRDKSPSSDGEKGDIEISLAYAEDSLTSTSSSNSGGPVPPPRFKKHDYTADELKPPPPAAPPRDRSSTTAPRTARQPTRVRAASFLTVSAGKELNTVSVIYMGSKQVDHYVGQINDIARELQEKQSSSIILYIATEKIRLAAPNTTVLIASFAVENILATTLCAINKRIVGILVWKSRSLPSWHLIRCPDNLVAVGVLEAVQMACETVKSDEIMEVRPLSQITVVSNGSTEEEQPKTSELFRKFPVIFIGEVKVGSEVTTVSEMIDDSLQTLVPSASVEAQLWLSIYQVRLISVTSGLMFAQYDTSHVKLFGTLARDKRYLGIVVADTESARPSTICVIIRCKTLAHVVTILSYLREACQVSFLETVDNTNAMSSSSTIDREGSIKLDDEDDSENDEQFAMEILKSFSEPNKAKTLPLSSVTNKKTIKARLKSIKGTLTSSFDKAPSAPLSIPAESTFRSHIQAGDHSTEPVKSPLGKQMSFSKLSNPEEYAKFTMTYIGSATLEGAVTGSTVYDALQAIEEGGVAGGAALVAKNQITFVAAANGVTLVDPSEKMFFTRHYPKNQIDAFLRGPDRSNIMGFVTKMTGFNNKFKCHLLAEAVEPLSQIFSAAEYWLQLDNETLV